MRKRGRFGSLLCATIAVAMAALIGAAGFGSTASAQQAQTSALAIVQSPAGDPSHHVLLAQAPPAPPTPPQWGFGRLVPQGTVLPRDRQRPPAVIGFFFRMNPPAGWQVRWSNNVQASAQRLTQEISPQGQAERQLFFRIDPCQVTGLDMPDVTEIPITYEFVFSATHPTQGPWTRRLSRKEASS